jgi:RNA polymerase sigma factor (sigma-70 family)
MVRRESLSVSAKHQRAVFISGCFPATIDIPPGLQDRPVETFQISLRLADALRGSGVRVLGDLHGRKVGEFAWEKNCSFETLHELDSLTRCVSHDYSIRAGLACSLETSNDKRRKNVLSRGIPVAIPESVSGFRFDELPITRRLANFLRSIQVRKLGDLNGCIALELLKHEGCGWRTISEIQQLIERAISGEFDEAQVKEHTAAAELMYVAEQAIAKLPPHKGEFVLARIEGLTFAEIGRQYGLTRARVHQVFEKAVEAIKKNYGPRIPRLLQLVKRRCMSIPNGGPLTPALFEQWTGNAGKSFRLSREAQLRLLAALDKNIPCWVEGCRKASGTSKLDLATAARALRLATAPEIRRDSGAWVRDGRYLSGDLDFHPRHEDNLSNLLRRRPFVADF